MTARRVAVLLSAVVLGLFAGTAHAQIRQMNLSQLAGGWSGRVTGEVTLFNEFGRPIHQFQDTDPFVHKFTQTGAPVVVLQTRRGQRAVEITHVGQKFDFDNIHDGETVIVIKGLFVRGDRVSYAFDFVETRNNGREFHKIHGSIQRDFDLGRFGLEMRQTIEKRITISNSFGRIFDTEHRKEVWFGRLGQD